MFLGTPKVPDHLAPWQTLSHPKNSYETINTASGAIIQVQYNAKHVLYLKLGVSDVSCHTQ